MGPYKQEETRKDFTGSSKKRQIVRCQPVPVRTCTYLPVEGDIYLKGANDRTQNPTAIPTWSRGSYI